MKKEKSPSERKAWNPVLVVALSLCVLFGVAALTYSWLTKSATAVPSAEDDSTQVESIQIEDFTYKVEYSFDGSSWKDCGTDGRGGIKVNYSDSDADNYIGDLRFRMNQSGTVKSAVRVKFAYQWYETVAEAEQAAQGPAINLTPSLSEGWSAADDGYCYYGTAAAYVFPQGENVEIASGFTVGEVNSRTNLKIIALVDGVQFNRYRQVWDLDSFPITAD